MVVWTLAFLLFGFLRNFGWPPVTGFKPEYNDTPGLNLALGFVVGTLYVLIERLMNRRSFRRLSFGRWAALKSVPHLLLAFGLFVLAVLLYPVFGGESPPGVSVREVVLSRLLIVALVYFGWDHDRRGLALPHQSATRAEGYLAQAVENRLRFFASTSGSFYVLSVTIDLPEPTYS